MSHGEPLKGMTKDGIGLLLPYPGGDGSWIDGALEAAERLEDLGAEVRFGVPDELPGWDVVVCHGIQYEDVVRRTRREGQTVILSDVPFDRSGIDGVTSVDWAWNAGAYCAGAAAAAASDGRPVGLIAGPAVRTQARLAYAFAVGVSRGATDEAPAPELVTVHLPRFDDVEGGVRAGERLARDLGCSVVAHTADAAGAAGVARAADAGASTIGFLGDAIDGADGRLAVIRSDIPGVLERLVRSAVAGDTLPELVTCTFENGGLALDLAESASNAVRQAAGAAAADLRRGLPLP